VLVISYACHNVVKLQNINVAITRVKNVLLDFVRLKPNYDIAGKLTLLSDN
jgi:hypothetical protein